MGNLVLSRIAADHASTECIGIFLALTELEKKATDAELYCGFDWLEYQAEVDPHDRSPSRLNLYLDKKHGTFVKVEDKACKDGPRSDAFHIIKEPRVRMVILCDDFLSRLENEVDRNIKGGISINEFRDNSLAATLAREVLLIGIQYEGRTFRMQDQQLEYYPGIKSTARRFTLCHQLALTNPDRAVNNADSIVLFGIGQNLIKPCHLD